MRRSIAVPCLALLALQALVSAALAQSSTSAQGPQTARPEPIPIDLAFVHKETHRVGYQPAMSRDGRWLAYEVFTPKERTADAALEKEVSFLPNGMPAYLVGTRLFVVGTSGGAERAVCAEDANCWRPSWSPDGRYLAYYSDRGGAPQAWIYDLEKGTSRLVSDARVKARLSPMDRPAWSPDGRELFLPLAGPAESTAVAAPPQARSGSPTVDVRRTGLEAPPAEPSAAAVDTLSAQLDQENTATLGAVDVGTGQVRVVVPADTRPHPTHLQVSPDGRWLSYHTVFRIGDMTAASIVFDVGIAPAAGGERRVVDTGIEIADQRVGDEYLWTPDSRHIVYPKGKKLWVVDVGTNGTSAPRQLGADLGELTPEPFLLSPDGRSVLVGLAPQGQQAYSRVAARALAIVPVDGGTPRVVSASGVPVLSDRTTFWQPDAGSLALVRTDAKAAERSVVRVDVLTGATTTLWNGRGRFTFVGASPDRAGVVALFESPDTPPNYYRFDAAFANRQQLSHAEPRLEGVPIGGLESFETTIPGPDGNLMQVRSAVFLPPGARSGQRLPTLVYFYSGSQFSEYAQDFGGGTPGSVIPIQIFATRGYAVLFVDVPLSPMGVGGNPVQEMAEAILPQVYRAAELGYTDIARVGILGHSYGGYSTAAMITQTNLFRAAVAVDGSYDLPGNYGTGDFPAIWSEGGQGRMGSHPWGDLRRYVANSPYYQADKIHTPLLLIHGKSDDTCPVQEAEKMFNALKRLNRTAQLAVYAGEGHVPGEWSRANAVDAAERMLAFFGKYLGTSGGSSPTAK
jgi:dipeptidyl aminopeptidase/acylaminoacyl peptidase